MFLLSGQRSIQGLHDSVPGSCGRGSGIPHKRPPFVQPGPAAPSFGPSTLQGQTQAGWWGWCEVALAEAEFSPLVSGRFGPLVLTFPNHLHLFPPPSLQHLPRTHISTGVLFLLTPYI